MHQWVISAGHWLLTKAGAELFDMAKRRLLESAGLVPSADADRSRLLGEYSRLLEEQLSSIIVRLDQDRIAALNGALAQLRAARDSKLQHGYLANAASTFFAIANLPESGRTGGIENRQLKAISVLALASVHAQVGEKIPDIAEGVATAIYLHRETATAWLGEDVVSELLKLYPESAPSPDPRACRAPAAEPGIAERPKLALAPNVDVRRRQVQDAMKNRSRGDGRVNFRDRDFAGVDLSRLKLRPADFSSANLKEADLSWAAPGGGGFFSDHTRFRDADLTGAILADSDFSRCELRGAKLRKVVADRANFDQAEVDGVDFSEARFAEAHLTSLSSRNVNFTGADLSMSWMHGSVFRDSNFGGASLAGAHCNFSLRNVHAANLNAECANFESASLVKVDFTGARLAGAVLKNADLADVYLEGADLRGADLRDAKIPDIDLRRTDFEGADLRGVVCTPRTAWPDGFTPLAHGVIVNNG